MELNKYIDHTNLKAYATHDDIKKLCEEAITYNFASVCVNPYYVSYAKRLLESSDVKVCTVIGFPLGMNMMQTKLFEAKEAVSDGADELDMVINVGALKEKNYDLVEKEIAFIRKIAENKVLKVIIETCYLDEEEIITMTKICNSLGVDYIKTSTGYGTRGASNKDVLLMNDYKDDNLQIKASGGIKTYEKVRKLIKCGATRIGTSSGVEIMKGREEI